MIFKRIVGGSKYTFAPFRLIWALLCRSSSILMTSPSLLIRRLNCTLMKMMIIDYQHWYEHHHDHDHHHHHHHHPKLVVLWLGAIIQIASESPFFHCLASHASIFSPIVSSSFIMVIIVFIVLVFLMVIMVITAIMVISILTCHSQISKFFSRYPHSPESHQ